LGTVLHNMLNNKWISWHPYHKLELTALPCEIAMPRSVACALNLHRETP